MAKILAWAYYNAGEQKTWQGFLEQKIVATNGDAKARWLLARAYAESIVFNEPSPLRGKKWFDQALDTAKSASVRIAAMKQIIPCYKITYKYDKGEEFLDLAARRFPDSKTCAGIQSLRTELVQSEVKYLTKRIALARVFAKKMDALAAQSQEEKDRKFYLKWAEYDRQKEKELILRLEQIKQ